MTHKFTKIVIALAFLHAHCLIAQQPIQRHILALYSSHQQETPKVTRIHQNVEMILNHLGSIVDYYDIDRGMLNSIDMSKYRGIISWFEKNDFPNKKSFMRWLPQQLSAGIQYVHFGSFSGFQADGGKISNATSANFFNALGLRCNDNLWEDNPGKIEIVQKNSSMVEFERTLENELTFYTFIRPTMDGFSQHLTLQLKNSPQTQSLLIANTPWGGFAMAPYILYDDNATFKRQWRLNPFAFFEKAFDLHSIPKPDVTTLNGCRIWYSHIDGDALVSMSEIGEGVYCGELVRDSILQIYNLPVSVSVVIAELLRGKKFEQIARSIFDLQNIEAASHSFSHPFYWDKNYPGKDEYPYQHLPVKNYAFDIQTEVSGSVDFINRYLLPAGKQVAVYFWSGNCLPTEQAIAICDSLGLPNINGGDTIFDNKNLSYTNVAPLSVPVGNALQFYATNSNENIYTDEWSGPYFGFLNVLRTFENTESPRRIRPIDVYYHFYSAEKWASFNALKHVIESSTAEIVAPVFTSDYLRIAQGFFSTHIRQVGKRQWEIENNGACKTIRFDEHAQFQPDMHESSNVLGFLQYQNALYIHLGPAESSKIVLTTEPETNLYLRLATHTPKNLQMTAENIQFTLQGFGSGFFEFCNLPVEQNFTLRVGKAVSTIRSDNQGNLQLNCEIRGAVDIEITPINL